MLQSTQLKQVWYPSKDSMRDLFNNIKFSPNNTYFKITFLIPEHLALKKGTVLDLETTGLPHQKKAKIITAGFLSNRLLEIYQVYLPYKLAEFQNVVKNVLLKRPFPLIGYSCEFERDFTKYGKPKKVKRMGSYYDGYGYSYWEEDIWKNILQWGIGYGRYNGEPYEYRKKLVSCVASPRDDKLGEEVPHLWFDYLNNGNFDSLFEIFYHNVLDVLRETYVANNIRKEQYYELVIVNGKNDIIKKRLVKNSSDGDFFYTSSMNYEDYDLDE